MIMPSLPHCRRRVKCWAMEMCLPQFADISFSFKADAQLASDRAGSPITSDQVICFYGRCCACVLADCGGHPALVLLEGQKLATEPDFYVGQCANDRAQ